MNRVMHAAMDITARAPIATANAFALACEGQFQQASTVMPLVFISYSRKDFYFAESLAFHLTKRGIANWLDANHLTPGSDWAADIDRALDQAGTVIVVLTPDSLRSKYVRGEWQRALQQGDRILFAQFRSCVPPAELRDAEMIDFRGRFRLALERLIARIKADRVAQVDRNRRSFGVPPWVLVFTITLFLISIVPFAILGDWNTGELVREPVWFQVLCWIFAPFFFGFLLWHLAIAFLRRRMGMTRLALTISFFTGLFAFYLSGQLRLIEPITAWMVQNHVPHMSLLVLIGVPLLGVVALAILLLVRPEDLLRWCSTGKAWDIYRRGRVVQVPDVATRLAQLGTFHLLHDHEDAPAAARLRQQLLAVGNTESMPATTSGVQILFLTNRTRAAWAGEKALRLTSDLITIVGSAISLPESLRALWRRQWIDLRRWDAARSRCQPVPDVPEGMTRLRLPAIVRWHEHLLCAMTGLLLILTNVALGDTKTRGDTFSGRDLLGYLVATACYIWFSLGWQLVQRTITRHRFLRRLNLLTIATPVLVAGTLWLFISLGGAMHYIIAPSLFVVLVLIILRHGLARLEFWFPAPTAPGTERLERLMPRRKWEPLIWLFVYGGAWMLLMGLQS